MRRINPLSFLSKSGLFLWLSCLLAVIGTASFVPSSLFACDPNQGGDGDPDASGDFVEGRLDFDTLARGYNFLQDRVYHSQSTTSEANGYGWEANTHTMRIEGAVQYVLYDDQKDSPHTLWLIGDDGTWYIYYTSPYAGYLFPKRRMSDSAWKVTRNSDGRVWEFNSSGILTRQIDERGNAQVYYRDEDNNITKIEDTLDRSEIGRAHV